MGFIVNVILEVNVMTDDEKKECKSKEWQWAVGTKCSEIQTWVKPEFPECTEKGDES